MTAPRHRPGGSRLYRRRRGRAGAARPVPPLLFRGWLVVAGAFLVLMVGFGVSFSYAAIAAALEAEFGASRTAVSLVFAIGGFSSFASSVVTGPLADRIGPRPVALIGMVLVSLGLMMAAAARSLLEIYLCYGLVIGLGIGFAYVPAVAAVQRWFATWRGLASGIATAGVGFGTALVPAGISAMVAAADWRVALLVAGCGALLVGIAGALLLSSSPESRGLLPDGVAAPDGPGTLRPALDGEDFPAVLFQRRFWLLYAGTLLVSIPVALPFAHLARTAEDAGLAASHALSLLGIIGVTSIVGRCACGVLADEIGRLASFLACCAAIAALMLVWAFAWTEEGFFGFAVGFGIAYGGFVALLPAFTADCFGRRSTTSIIGVLYTGRGIALLAGAPVMAALLDRLGAPLLPLIGAALLGGIGTLAVARAGAPRAAATPVGIATALDSAGEFAPASARTP